ncbi:MAG: hypothetical protein KF683_14435, partial [Rubrivivax sp.]|nr:hypothetical protein [Rubrivivax sp.]
MKVVLMLAGGSFALLLLFFVIGVAVGPQAAKAAPSAALPADAQAGGGFDLHGLARVPLPKAFRFRGLDVYNGHLSPAEQLVQHDDPRGLVFRFDAHARNDWGGNARDPKLLNVVLMNPRQPPANPERGFSIGRYFSPTGSTIPLDDARWQQRREAVAGGERVWRWLEMNDHFGSDAAPRWAISVYEASRALRLDLFVWRRMMSLDEARSLLAGTLDALAVHPSRDAHFQRPGTREERLAVLREARIAQFFDALAPLGVARPAPGGSSFGADTAGWLDADGKSLRAMRVLAQVPLPPDAARDEQGRPQLALAAQPGQGAGRPAQLPLRMLYWHADSGSWRYTRLVQPTARDDWQLLDFERTVVARLPDRG